MEQSSATRELTGQALVALLITLATSKSTIGKFYLSEAAIQTTGYYPEAHQVANANQSFSSTAIETRNHLESLQFSTN